MNKNIKFLIQSILCISFLSLEANGFTLTRGGAGQTNIGWKKNEIPFDIDVSCNAYRTKVESAINAAIDVWNAVPTSALKVTVGSTVTLPSAITTYVGNTATQYAPIANPIVYCDSSFAANSGQDANSIPGFAGATNMKSDGQIQGALLVLNVQAGATASVNSLDATLTTVILTHEIGHVFGLGHSADTEAMMYYQTGAGRQPVLAKDDMDGISYLYPREEPGSGLMGCNSIRDIRSGYGPYPESSSKKSNGNAAEFLILLAIWSVSKELFKRKSAKKQLVFSFD